MKNTDLHELAIAVWNLALDDIDAVAIDTMSLEDRRLILGTLLIKRITAALEQVVEECAKVAENPLGPGLADCDDHWGPRIAAAIRQGAARGRRGDVP